MSCFVDIYDSPYFKKGTGEMTKSNQSSLDIADHLSRGEYDWCPEAETRLREQHDRIKELEANPVKGLTDEEIYEFTHRMIICSGQNPNAADINIFGLTRIVEDILRKANEK